MAWPDPGSYTKYLEITLDYDDVASGNETDVVALLVLTDTDAIANADIASKRYDIADANGTWLPYEERYYNEGASYANAKIFIEMPTLYSSPTGDQNKVRIYFGNDPGSDQDDINTTWSNSFSTVHSLAESSGTSVDLTGNSHTGTFRGSLPDAQTGKIYQGQDFDGTSDSIEYTSDWDIPEVGHISVWAESDDALGGSNNRALFAFVSISGDAYQFRLFNRAASSALELRWIENGPQSAAQVSSTGISTQEWFKLDAQWNHTDGDMKIFLNGGASTGTDSNCYWFDTSTGGADQDGIGAYKGTSFEWDGVMEQLEISSVERSDNYVAWRYDNENESDWGQTHGSVTAVPSTVSLTAAINTSVLVTADLSNIILFSTAVNTSVLVTADLSNILPLSTAINTSVLVTADLSNTILLAAAITGSNLVTANININKQLVVIITSNSLITADINISKQLISAITGSSSVTANLSKVVSFSAVINSSSLVTANLSLKKPLTASIVTFGQIDPGPGPIFGISLNVIWGLTATNINASNLVAANINISKQLAANTIGSSVITGELNIDTQLAATITSSGLVTADLAIAAGVEQLAADITASGSVTSELNISKQLSAAITSTVLVTANINIDKQLAANITCSGSVTSELNIDTQLAASVVGNGSVTANLSLVAGIKPLNVDITVSGTVTANLLYTYRYFLGTTVHWDDTANWSDSSGGASGASIPTSTSEVIFDSNSTGDCTLRADANCKSLVIGTNGSLYTDELDANGYNVSVGTGGLNCAYGGSATLKLGSGAWTVEGSFNANGAGTFYNNSGTVNLIGDSVTHWSNTSHKFYDLNVSGDCQGTFYVENTMDVSSLIYGTAWLHILDGCTLTVSDTGGITGVLVTFYGNNTFNADTSGTYSTNIDCEGSTTFNKTGAGSSIDIGGDIDFSTALATHTFDNITWKFNDMSINVSNPAHTVTLANNTNNPSFELTGHLDLNEVAGSITWTKGTGSITFTGSSTEWIGSDITDVLEEIIINKDTATSKIYMSNDVYTAAFTGTRGRFDLDGYTIYSDGNVSVDTTTGFQFHNGSDNDMDQGIIDLDGGTLTLTGTNGTHLEIYELNFNLAAGVTGSGVYCDVYDSDVTYVDSEIDGSDNCSDDNGNTGWFFGIYYLTASIDSSGTLAANLLRVQFLTTDLNCSALVVADSTCQLALVSSINVDFELVGNFIQNLNFTSDINTTATLGINLLRVRYFSTDVLSSSLVTADMTIEGPFKNWLMTEYNTLLK